ncbi:MAG: glycosyltransferase family 1 protein [Bacteroidota bacterium]
MIIAYDVSYIQHRRGGIGWYSLRLLTDLLGHETRHQFILHGWSNSIDLPAIERLEGGRVQVRAARIPGFIKRAYWERLRFPPLTTFVGRYDLFHSADPSIPPARSRNAIVTVYDLISRSHPEMFEPHIVRRDSRLHAALRRARAVIVPSRFTRDELVESRSADPDRIAVVPPSIPREFTPDPQPADAGILKSYGLTEPYLLFVGTIEPRKNIPGLIRAFEALSSRCKERIVLVLVGKLGWLSRDIPAMIAASSVRDRIRHLDYIPPEVLPAMYRGALAVLYPSFIEGFGLPVAEGLASGVPVVTSDRSGMAEIAGDAAILVDPRSSEQLAAAVEQVVSSSSLRADLRMRGLRWAEELRKQDGAAAVLRLYDELEHG